MKIAYRNLPPLVYVPVGLFLLAALVLAACPSSADWPRQPWFLLLPYVLYLLAAVLGGVFTQSRISFLAVAAAATLAQVDHAFFVAGDTGRGQSALLLGTLVLPAVAAVFFRLSERGLCTVYGGLRGLAVLIVLGITFTLTLSAGFRGSAGALAAPAPRPDLGWVGVPGVGLLALLAAAPFLVLRRKGESPLLGPVLLTALVFMFAGFGFQCPIWRETQHRTVLLLFASLGALMLWGAVLETSWRHMNIDELTELPGRRPFRHKLRCLRDSYVLAIVDLDYFKRVNDTYGHVAGDQVLRFLASELSRHAAGKVYRYGGEEFVIVYEGKPYEAVLNDLDDIRETVARKEFRLRSPDRPARKPRKSGAPGSEPSGQQIQLTVSIGAARPCEAYPTPQEVLDAADQALYRAKETGRNRVCRVT
jgi:diguanylate cyclase (GGDEF)-like protein